MLPDNGAARPNGARSGRYPLRLRSSMARVTASGLSPEESARSGNLSSAALGGKPALSTTTRKGSVTGRRIGVGRCVH
jgi:hypothetical protein